MAANDTQEQEYLSPEDAERETRKRIFKDAAEQRKLNGIRLGRFSIMAETSQVEALYILYDSWVERWGKKKAVDGLIQVMATVNQRARDKEVADEYRKNVKKQEKKNARKHRKRV